MRKWLLLLALYVVFIAVALYGCAFYAGGHVAEIRTMPRYRSSEEHWDDQGFADYVDYCKYFYNERAIAQFADDERFLPVTETDITNLRSYFNNFNDWMEACERLDEYDFDNAQLKPGDYFYIRTKEGESIGTGTYRKFDNYNVYYVDVEKCIMYYLHVNI